MSGPHELVEPHPRLAGRRAGPLVMLLALTIVQVGATSAAAAHEPAGRPPDAVSTVLLLIGPIALVVAGPGGLTGWFWPVPVLAVTTAATVSYLSLGYGYGPLFLALIATIIVAVATGRRAGTWITVWAGFGLFALAGWLGGRTQHFSLASLVGQAAFLLIVLLGSEAVRLRRERVAAAAQAAAAERARRADEERLMIAQELHDVLAHDISMMNVQAGVGLHLLDEQPEQARAALTAIKRASVEALGELRSVLDVLRAGGAAPRAPTAGLAGLPELVRRTSATGLRVELDESGRAHPLPTAVQLAAYRIVQESLTNVVKHADASQVTVAVRYREDELELAVRDDGAAPAKPDGELPGSGAGIAGMRRRARMLGGSLAAGPTGAGFEVRARIPLGAQALPDDGAVEV